MQKFSTFFMALAGAMLISSISTARVCFLASSDDDTGCLVSDGYDIEESEKCYGMQPCEQPNKNAPTCIDNSISYYSPENCCSNTALYEKCEGTGKICKRATCSGSVGGESYSYCRIGYCGCSSEYSETCDASKGLVGVGDACDGKYKSCRCNSSFQPCDKNGTCSGTSCKDDRGTLYQDCECPAVGTNGWVADPSSCCGTYTTTCTNRPSGKRVYKCKTVSTPSCVCGLTHDTNNSQCVSGCTDSRYEYVGNIPANAICNDYTGGIMSPCGSSCRCQSGYWDYTSSCDTQNSNICGELGYTDKSCSDDWIACPFDPSAKKCLN